MPATVSETDRAGIIAALGAGHTQTAIAAEFGVARSTVARFAALATAAGHDAINPLASNWREVQIGKAVRAVDAGLDASQDPYKRAQIGLQALKGHGILNNDTTVKLEAHFHSSGAKQIAALDAELISSTSTSTPALLNAASVGESASCDE